MERNLPTPKAKATKGGLPTRYYSTCISKYGVELSDRHRDRQPASGDSSTETAMYDLHAHTASSSSSASTRVSGTYRPPKSPKRKQDAFSCDHQANNASAIALDGSTPPVHRFHTCVSRSAEAVMDHSAPLATSPIDVRPVTCSQYILSAVCRSAAPAYAYA